MEFAKLLDLYRPTYCNFPYQSVAISKIAARSSCRKRKRDAIFTSSFNFVNYYWWINFLVLNPNPQIAPFELVSIGGLISSTILFLEL
jgi:hypothetical protein